MSCWRTECAAVIISNSYPWGNESVALLCHEECFGQIFVVLASMGWQEIVALCPVCLSSSAATGVMCAGSSCPEWNCSGDCSQIFAADALAVRQCLSLAPSFYEWVCPVLENAMQWQIAALLLVVVILCSYANTRKQQPNIIFLHTKKASLPQR